MKNKLNKPVVHENILVQSFVQKISRPKLLVSAPPARRSKRLRHKASGCKRDGVNVLNKDALSKPKKKKRNNKVQGKKKVSSTLTFSQRALKGHNRFWIVGIVKDSNSLFRAFAHQL